MELQHINAKLFVESDESIDLEQVVEMFHQWVGEQSLEELLIDVADYRHVPSGPSVILLALEADYVLDSAGQRLGLVYNRKAPLDGTNADRLRQALMSAAIVAERLENGLSGLKFDRTRFELCVNDRALAPNTPQTYEACRPEVESFISNVLGQSNCRLTHNGDPRSRFSISIELSAPMDFANLAAA